MNREFLFALPIVLVFSVSNTAEAQQYSVARQWNEVMLEAIRHDFARPPIHARNLFHSALVMYDAWAAYDHVATTCLLGKTLGGFTCAFNGIQTPANVQAARNEAISYAIYRLLTHRFKNSPGAKQSLAQFDSLFTVLGCNAAFTSMDYTTGSAAALGNYIGQSVIDFGLQDGANELHNFAYEHYKPLNPPLITLLPGNSGLIDPNRWQPLTLEIFIDQAGNIIPGNTPKFIGPEWGRVTPFALAAADRTIYTRDGYDYWVYHDPGPMPYLDTLNTNSEQSEAYKWAYTLVPIWQSHLDPTDGTMWDISPAAIGNVPELPQLPQTLAELRNFYNLFDGGDPGKGRSINPRSGQPYKPQFVPRGDYTRVLAEFWADGPTSETPPGHWFTILNKVNDHPAFQKQLGGQGPILDDLEWDVKAYLALGGAIHDAAITAWGIKGWYDTIRPISVIRWMAARGQSTDRNLPRYSPVGIPLIPGYIELVQATDSLLAGPNGENVGKIKLYTWRGHDYITDPTTDVAGVGWILAEKWWPYQRMTFVTPPFAGYVSGHSTYSRAAAEVMTLLTGDEFFPDGMGEFHAKKNEFLVFEDGPSVDVTLQWATYRDAADQCSLSRIWGGIHPPVDDIPGRLIGKKLGVNAFLRAEQYFAGKVTEVQQPHVNETLPTPPTLAVYPNPINSGKSLTVELSRLAAGGFVQLYNIQGQLVHNQALPAAANQKHIILSTKGMASGIYLLRVGAKAWKLSQRVLVIK
jgi:hypothetical protein